MTHKRPVPIGSQSPYPLQPAPHTVAPWPELPIAITVEDTDGDEAHWPSLTSLGIAAAVGAGLALLS